MITVQHLVAFNPATLVDVSASNWEYHAPHFVAVKAVTIQMVLDTTMANQAVPNKSEGHMNSSLH